MKLVSWNVWNQTSDIAAFERFVRQSGADLFAFQELTETHIEILKDLEGFCLHLAEDFVEDGQLTWLGLCTRYPVVQHQVTTLNTDRNVSASWVGRRNGWIECLDSQCAVLDTEFGEIGITNLHLSCAVSPRQRRQALGRALRSAPAGIPAIVCGDMNSFASVWTNWIVGWFYGFSAADLITNEVRDLKSYARGIGFGSVPELGVTFPSLRLRLDHVFARALNISTAVVADSLYGSDHRPIVCEISKPPA